MRSTFWRLPTVILVLTGCADLGTQASISSPELWVTLDASQKFSLRAPPGTTYQPLMGIDQFGGEFAYSSFDIQFTFGTHNPDLVRLKNDPAYAVRPLQMERTEAIIYTVKGSGKEGDCAYTWVGLLTGPLGPPRIVRDTFRGVPREVRFPPDTLHMLACVRAPNAIEAVQQIYATVRVP